ncbi:hypothetical protein GY50_1384 [Dehalococcoides mccartyi GY50]|nr:hypothetical protein GY50_1384 [Dehalococcoides mccartyi GY50]
MNSQSDILRTYAPAFKSGGMFLALVETGEGWLRPERKMEFLNRRLLNIEKSENNSEFSI